MMHDGASLSNDGPSLSTHIELVRSQSEFLMIEYPSASRAGIKSARVRSPRSDISEMRELGRHPKFPKTAQRFVQNKHEWT